MGVVPYERLAAHISPRREQATLADVVPYERFTHTQLKRDLMHAMQDPDLAVFSNALWVLFATEEQHQGYIVDEIRNIAPQSFISLERDFLGYGQQIRARDGEATIPSFESLCRFHNEVVAPYVNGYAARRGVSLGYASDPYLWSVASFMGASVDNIFPEGPPKALAVRHAKMQRMYGQLQERLEDALLTEASPNL